jgi:SAM-dependent methyltransferase
LQSNVAIRQGTAESLPFGDKTFDAVVALWILHYVDDLEKSLTEMVRVVNPSAPHARIVIVQGAPDNEVVNFINEACAPIAEERMTSSAVDHQGMLLETASRTFTRLGFGDITLKRVSVSCGFPEEDLVKRCDRASTVLADFWYYGHPQSVDMKRALQPILREHFALEFAPYAVGDQGVMLVAKPTAAKG